MINQLEVPMFVEDAIPELSAEIAVNKKNNVYSLMTKLVAFTCKNVKEHNFSAVKRSFQIADKLYSKGNENVKNAVQNIFVFSFTRIFQSYPSEKKQLLSLLPVTLYTLYISQVCHKGC